MKRRAILFFLLFLLQMGSVPTLAAEPTVAAQGAALIDGKTGRLLWGKNADAPLAMAMTIDNESGTTNAAVMFEEGDSVTAVVLGDESEFDTDEYTVNVNYGNETVSYKLKDLIEMAEK